MRLPEIPFVTRSAHQRVLDDHDRIRRENVELRHALRRANEELRKHRLLVGGLRSGTVDVVGALDRISKGGRG